MDIVTIINLCTVAFLALLILLMKFNANYLNRLATYALAIFLIPLLIAITGRVMGWFDVHIIDILSLRQGSFSVIVATGYGLMVGIILNSSKLHLINIFRHNSSHS